MELKYKLGLSLLFIVLIVSIVSGATSKSFVNLDMRQNSIYNVSNLTVSGNFSGPQSPDAWHLANYSAAYAASGFDNENFTARYDARADRYSIVNYSAEYSASGFDNLNWTTLWNAVAGALWKRANETKFTNENFTDQLAGNISDIRESLWDEANNASKILNNATICRTGKNCNLTNLNVTGLLNISLGFVGVNQIATLKDLTAGNVTITSEIEVRNDEPVTLNKGDPVYFTSYISGLALQGVNFANNTDITKHADCIIAETIATNARGQCVETGHVIQADTSNFAFADDLYLDTGGNLSPAKPIHANCIQKVGMVLRVHGSLGVIWVSGADRCNDAPKDINITGNVTLNTLFGKWNGSAAYTTTIDLTSLLAVKLANGSAANFSEVYADAYDISWANLSNYPAACPSGSFVSTLNDEVTCTSTPDVYLFDGGDNYTGFYNHTFGNTSHAENGTSCYGWNCDGQIYFNGSSMVIKVT